MYSRISLLNGLLALSASVSAAELSSFVQKRAFLASASKNSLLAPRQDICTGSTCPGDVCIPLGYHCCSDGGAGCPVGQNCVPNGCCPIGKSCSGGGGTTTLSGALPTGTDSFGDDLTATYESLTGALPTGTDSFGDDLTATYGSLTGALAADATESADAELSSILASASADISSILGDPELTSLFASASAFLSSFSSAESALETEMSTTSRRLPSPRTSSTASVATQTSPASGGQSSSGSSGGGSSGGSSSSSGSTGDSQSGGTTSSSAASGTTSEMVSVVFSGLMMVVGLVAVQAL